MIIGPVHTMVAPAFVTKFSGLAVHKEPILPASLRYRRARNQLSIRRKLHPRGRSLQLVRGEWLPSGKLPDSNGAVERARTHAAGVVGNPEPANQAAVAFQGCDRVTCCDVPDGDVEWIGRASGRQQP